MGEGDEEEGGREGLVCFRAFERGRLGWAPLRGRRPIACLPLPASMELYANGTAISHYRRFLPVSVYSIAVGSAAISPSSATSLLCACSIDLDFSFIVLKRIYAPCQAQTRPLTVCSLALALIFKYISA